MREGGIRSTSLRQRINERDIHIHKDFTIVTINPLPEEYNTIPNSCKDIPNIHMPVLGPISLSNMNSLSGSRLSNEYSNTMRTTNGANGTIRSVPSDSLHLETRYSEEEPRRSLSKPDSPMPHSASLPQISGSRAAPPLAWQNSKQLGIGNGVVRKMSSEFGPTKLYTGGLHVVENGSPVTNGDSPSQESRCACGHVCGQSNEGAEKKTTSKFLERVMSERDAYKRELAAERLKSKEANDALDFLKARLDRINSDHESEMHDATVHKTLLKRKERQLEDMKGKIDIERQRAEAALEQEKVWKRDLDNLKTKCREKVDDAENYAAMMEAQNNTMVRHWKSKQAEIDKQREEMQKTHDDVRLLLQKEADKSKRLQEICDQYRVDNDRLSRINEAQFMKHEEYKVASEESLKDIKRMGAKFGQNAETYLEEATALKDKLKWSLNVSKEFKDLPSAVDKL